MQRLWNDRSGTAGIEFALLIPVLILLFIGSITLFDLYRQYWRQVQSTHIVSDLISRETTVDDKYLTKIYDIYSGLLNLDVAARAIRVTSVAFDGKSFSATWSVTKGDGKAMPKQELAKVEFPTMSKTETVIFVETVGTHGAFSSYLGFGEMTFAQQAIARPRFVSAIVKN
ncbi:MAG: pilus assembly protein [Alphaproteobacteria bacterium]|nr:pilus assembly protein [Alphaproteobacteria bacterium]